MKSTVPPPAAAPKEHLHELDLLRGIACTMVVAFHFLFRGQREAWITDAAPAWLSGPAQFGYLGVQLFFIISGFVIFMSAEGATLRAFAASRAARLYPALWVAAPLTALAAWALGSDTFSVSPGALLLNLTLVPQWFEVDWVDGAYWSLAVELQFYLLMAAVIAGGWLAHIEKLLFAWLALTLLDQWRPTYPLEFWLAVHWAPYFCMGIACYLIRRHGANATRFVVLGLSWLLALSGWLHKTAASSQPVVDVLVPCLFVNVFFVVFLGIALRRWQWPPTRVGALAGALTYPLYLLHQNLGYLLIEAVKPTGLPLLLRVLLVTLAFVALAWSIHQLVERPLGRRLRRWLAPRPAASAGNAQPA